MGRFVVLASVVATVSSARASFELLLVADNGTGTFQTRKIHRYDPVSGVYLGSFGVFVSAITGTWLRQSTNSLFVADGGGLSEYDYNTGELKSSTPGTFGVSRFSVRPDGARVAVFDGFSDFLVGEFGGSGGFGTTGAIPGATYATGLWYSQSELMAYDLSGNQFIKAQMNAAGTSATIAGTTLPSGSATSGQMAQIGSSSTLVMASGDNLKIVNSNSLASGSFGFASGTAKSAARAHNGFFIGSTLSGIGTITYFDSLTNVRGQFGGGVLRDPVFMETVLAPEPGTILALGAGLAAILRRRRK